MTSQSNQALLVECQPRRLGSVPGCSAGAGRIRFVRTAGESTPDGLYACPPIATPHNHCLQWLSIVPCSQLPGIADFEGSSPGIVSCAQRWGPNQSRSPLSYLRNMRSRGPLSFSQSTGGVLMRRTLVGLIAALALGSVSPAAFAADIPPPEPVASWTGFYLGAGGGVGWADLDINRRRCEARLGWGLRFRIAISIATSTRQVMATSSASCRAASIGNSQDRRSSSVSGLTRPSATFSLSIAITTTLDFRFS